MPKIKLMSGKYGNLTVIEYVGQSENHRALWKCKCDCGNFCVVTRDKLTRKDLLQNCGCIQGKSVKQDLTGQKFNKLTVVAPYLPGLYGRTAWICKCDCGKEKIFTGNSLKRNNTTSCGCDNDRNNVIRENKKYGRLLVLEKLYKKKNSWYYKCLCDCGKEVIKKGSSLSSGLTKSCGCLSREVAAAKGRTLVREKNPRWRGGVAIDYEFRKTKEYAHWRKTVLNNGGKICKICGAKNNLHAHHLNSYISHPEERIDPNNGVILCKKCHDHFHMIYGYGDNTKAQFLEFVYILVETPYDIKNL